MLKRSHRGLIVMALLAGLAPAAGAQDITFISTPAGPGGTGVAAIDGGTSSAADVSLNFTGVAPISLSLDVDGAGGFLIHTDAGTGGIFNDTGVPWTSLLFEVSGPAGTSANTIGFDNPQYFAQGTIQPDYIYLFDGTVPVGAQYNIDLGFTTTQAGTIELTYIPNGVPVPEPSSLVALGVGLAGLSVPTLIRRRLRRRAAAPCSG